MFKKIVLWTLAILLLIQLIPVDRTNKPVEKSQNFVDVFATPAPVQKLLKNACYDCHSNETIYPNYAYVAPISWSIKHHINEGKEHLNFSVWTTYNRDLKKDMLENSVEEIQNKSMPLPGYISQHHIANLTTKDRQLLEQYFSEILKSGNY